MEHKRKKRDVVIKECLHCGEKFAPAPNLCEKCLIKRNQEFKAFLDEEAKMLLKAEKLLISEGTIEVSNWVIYEENGFFYTDCFCHQREVYKSLSEAVFSLPCYPDFVEEEE